MHLFMLRRQHFAPVFDHALGKFTLLSDLFGDSGKKNFCVRDDRQVHRRQLLKVTTPSAHYDIFERHVDHFAAGFGRRHVGVRIGVRAHQRAVKVGHVETHDDVGVGDQLAVSAGEIERVRVGEIQTRAEIDDRNRQQIGEGHQAHHRVVVPPHVVGQDHGTLRRRQ